MPIAPATTKLQRARLTLATHRGALLVIAMVTCLLLMAHLAAQLTSRSNEFRPIPLNAMRDYSLAPFDIVDAAMHCKKQTQAKFGETLTRSYVDDHSTRWDNDAALFKVFMMAHVGTLTNYSETAIHCFVDPHKQMLTHYRAINLKETSLISKALKFFQ